jgi:AcrR family transcriptional regulator
VAATTRGARTRQLIIERTSAVFDQQGFAAATLEQLVESTGLTRGAFYFHFDSKHALAEAIVATQADRWPPLLAGVLEQESDPLRGLIRFAFVSATAVQVDPVTRAAGRLVADQALIRRELPDAFIWWVRTVHDFLKRAADQGELGDLSGLIEPASITGGDACPADVTGVLAEYLVTMWMGLHQAAVAAGRIDRSAGGYTSWALVMPRLCARPEQCDDLLDLVAELTANLRRTAELATAVS